MSACEDCQLAWQGNSTRCPQCGKETVLNKVDDGGAAFPVPYHPEQTWENPSGMTLRDYFAARMMVYHLAKETTPHRKYNYMNAAIGAYEMADAMLAARKK